MHMQIHIHINICEWLSEDLNLVQYLLKNITNIIYFLVSEDFVDYDFETVDIQINMKILKRKMEIKNLS